MWAHLFRVCKLGDHLERAFRTALPLIVRATGGATVADRDPGRALEHRLATTFGLTPAEARAVTLVAQGRSRAAVAATAGIGINTLKTHLRRAYAKLEVARSSELVLRLARLSGQAAADQLPEKTGLRFSRNADTPSA